MQNVRAFLVEKPKPWKQFFACLGCLSSPHIGLLCLRVAWVENSEKHSCKCKSWAIWALSALPAICGEKEFLNYVNQRGRVGATLCLYSCSLGSSAAVFKGPERSSCKCAGEGFLEAGGGERTGVQRWLSSKCSWLLIVNSFKRKCIFILKI